MLSWLIFFPLITAGVCLLIPARAKGLNESRVVIHHVLQSACIPLIGYLGPALAGIMTGSLVIEMIFNLPGVGRYFVQGALNRDYPLVMGIVVIYATFIILLNLLSDLAYAGMDPRVRKSVRIVMVCACARAKLSWLGSVRPMTTRPSVELEAMISSVPLI